MAELKEDVDAVRASVTEYYGKVLSSKKDLKTSACTTSCCPDETVSEAMRLIPSAVTDKFYGCGCPLPAGIEGLSVLDLGCGSGQDCYAAAALVGPSGRVVGVDMTDEQLAVARDNVGAFAEKLGFTPDLTFTKGYIELLGEAGVAPASFDLIISNCVINLSMQKDRVIQGAYDALRVGGEMYFSDIYCDRRLPESVRKHEVLWGECIAGALYTEDFRRLCQAVGFLDPRVLSRTEVEVTDPALKAITGDARFFSITYRLFKLPAGVLEDRCEDYGQSATYKGTIPGHPSSYTLDDHHVLRTGEPFRVCGNSAGMVGDSWLGKHFEVDDRGEHRGLFDCGPVVLSLGGGETSACGPGSACC